MKRERKTYGLGVFKSMYIAYKNLLRPNITVQYPHERLELPPRARWAVAMKLDEEGQNKCTACLACQKACPDYIIDIATSKNDEGVKMIDSWRYDLGACMMCGLCVEACPFDAIQMSHEYELARSNPDDLTVYLLTNTPTARPKKKKAASSEGAAGASNDADKEAKRAAARAAAMARKAAKEAGEAAAANQEKTSATSGLTEEEKAAKRAAALERAAAKKAARAAEANGSSQDVSAEANAASGRTDISAQQCAEETKGGDA